MRQAIHMAGFLVLLVAFAACADKDSKPGEKDVKTAAAPEVKVGTEEVPPHATGPDDSGPGGLSPKAEGPLAVPAPVEEEQEAPAPSPGDLTIGLSEESLKTLSLPVAAILRRPDVKTDTTKVTFSYLCEEGRTARSKMHSRVTTRSEGAASTLSWDMTWTELYGARKGDLVPVKWVLQDLDFEATGASEEYVAVLERALEKLTLTYEVDTLGAVTHIQRQSEVPPQFAPLADALVGGFKQSLVELPREPRGVSGVWTAKGNASVMGAKTSTSVKYMYRGLVKGPKGQDWAYVDFTLRVSVEPEKGEGSRPKGKGLGRGAFLFDLEKGMDVAVALRLDLQEEFQTKAEGDDKKARQTVALEVVSERLP